MHLYFETAHDLFDQLRHVGVKDAIRFKRYTFQESLDRGLLEFSSGGWLDSEGHRKPDNLFLKKADMEKPLKMYLAPGETLWPIVGRLSFFFSVATISV